MLINDIHNEVSPTNSKNRQVIYLIACHMEQPKLSHRKPLPPHLPSPWKAASSGGAGVITTLDFFTLGGHRHRVHTTISVVKQRVPTFGRTTGTTGTDGDTGATAFISAQQFLLSVDNHMVYFRYRG